MGVQWCLEEMRTEMKSVKNEGVARQSSWEAAVVSDLMTKRGV